MEKIWPEARYFNLVDDSLPGDLVAQGGLTEPIVARFLAMGRYAASTGARGLLFTCSAFGPAIDAVKKDLDIPVLRPNEAAFERALALGARIGLLVTFERSLGSLRQELGQMAASRGLDVSVVGSVVEGALAALQSGRADEHDRLVADAARKLTGVDVIVLGQFSLARAADSIRNHTALPVITTPESAVQKMKGLVA